MEEIKNVWDPRLYNDKHSYVNGFGEELIVLLDPRSHERILDLGCGTGQLTYKISQSAKEVIGLDKSPEMIAEARSRYPDLDFHIGDASDFTFEERFDSIYSNAVLHWVRNYKGAIRSMYKNLEPGGKIVLEFGGKGNVHTIIYQLRVTLAERNFLKQSNLDQWYFPSIGEYSTELEKAGFRVTFAQHFDRLTELTDEDNGIVDWLTMFGTGFFAELGHEQKQEIKYAVQEALRPKCLKDGKWMADYRRIRVVAVRE